MKNIDKYEILNFLGKGAWSLVFKVKIPTINKIAALKLLQPDPLLKELMGMENMQSLFMREAQILGSIRHPHVLQVWDFGHWRKQPFFIMEFFCINLLDILGKGSTTRVLRIDHAVKYTLQILKGLQCLHEAGIIHRDIKPENLLITDDDQIKIADFGLVHIKSDPISNRVPKNLVIGSADYAAPEQVKKSQNITPATDIYSVGVLLYKMLSGRFPQDGVPISRLNPDCDREWDDLLGKALMPDPSDRYESANEMHYRLKKVYDAWHEKTMAMCTVNFDRTKEMAHSLKGSIRHQALTIPPSQAYDAFFLDELFRPKSWVENRYRAMGHGLILDEATGLLWEASGSTSPMPWHNALERARALNESAYGGVRGWHLPTVDELSTILDPVPHKSGHCIESLFDVEKAWLWSSDSTGEKKAWCANAKNGFIYYKDKNCYLFSRLVTQL